MKGILDPLALIPGVRLAALLSEDGVPIAVAGEEASGLDQDLELQSTTALAAGWLTEVSRAGQQLSWNVPSRAVLRAQNGTLVLHRSRAALVLCWLERGAAYEEVRVPIDGAIARMDRSLERIEPPAPLPSEDPSSAGTEASTVRSTTSPDG